MFGSRKIGAVDFIEGDVVCDNNGKYWVVSLTVTDNHHYFVTVEIENQNQTKYLPSIQLQNI